MIALIQCPGITGEKSAWGEGMDTCLLHVVDRPILQHVLETLADCGVRKLHVFMETENQPRQQLLGDGVRWGMCIRTWIGPASRAAMDSAIFSDLEESQDLILGYGDSLPQPVELIALKTRDMGLEGDGVAGSWAILSGESSNRWLQTQGGLLTITDRRNASWLDTSSPNLLLASQRQLLTSRLSAVPLFGREIKPDVWVGRGAKIDPSAVIQGPAYIGPFARIGRRCAIDVGSVIGEGAVVEDDTVIEASYVGNHTRVGKRLCLRDSLMIGNVLFSTRHSTRVTLSDRVLAGKV